MPGSLKVADACGSEGSLKVTGPGPLTTLQTCDRRLEPGKPSSLTEPDRPKLWPTEATAFEPALTTGGWLPLTTTVSSSNEASSVSVAVRRNTYVPAWLNETVVTGLVGFANVTSPGPLVLVQTEFKMPSGNPSSVTRPLR